MKTCKRCNIKKDLTTFNNRKHTSKYTGKVVVHYNSYCIPCGKLIALERRHSEIGMITDIYNGQLYSSKKRKMSPPNYTKDELSIWIKQQSNYNLLLTNWKNSNYSRNLKPSCDRLDDYKPYTLVNLQLITTNENACKAHKDMRNGTNNKLNKPVNQYNLNGELVATFHSIADAGRNTESSPANIHGCLTGKYKTSKKHIWRYVC